MESVYVKSLAHELEKEGLEVKLEVPVPVEYDNTNMGIGFILDILANNIVIVKVKSVETLNEVHHKQTMTYLKITNLKLAILVNFNVTEITSGIFRKVNRL